jgi:ribonuclease T1
MGAQLRHSIRHRLAALCLIALSGQPFVAAPVGAREYSDAGGAEIAVAELPSQARETLALIHRGGPFPYSRDGVTFGNYERQLPAAARGYYHEYTVPTPGAGNRGARRIITGGEPPLMFYYTADHYRSFRRIRDKP